MTIFPKTMALRCIGSPENCTRFSRRLATHLTSRKLATCHRLPLLGFLRIPSYLSNKNICINHGVGPSRCHFSTENDRRRIEKRLEMEFHRCRNEYPLLHEGHQYLDKTDWTFESKDGNLHMVLTKTIGDVKVLVEFRPSVFSRTKWKGAQSGEEQKLKENAFEFLYSQPQETTDFCVTYKKTDGKGISVFCTALSCFTVPHRGNPRRFLVGNIRCFDSDEDATSLFSYNGPESSDLGPELQEAFDDWLASIGIDGNFCDLVDELADQKERHEYTRWLSGMEKFFTSS